MPIKEEPVRIEFQYEQEDATTSDGVFNVEYYSETINGKEKKYLNITPHGESIPSTFEVDFLVEVVDFLRKKGVIDGEIPVVDITVENTGLKLPSIHTMVTNPEGSPIIGVASHVPEAVMTNPKHTIPISSFITNRDESQILDPPVVQSNPVSTPSNGPKVIISAPLTEETKKLIIKRPVIKTRIGEHEDPMAALEESRRQRGFNPQKAIKRKEATDEV